MSVIQALTHEGDSGRITELRLSRPPVNALDQAMLASLGEQVKRAAADSAALVISGSPGVFSAGLDVRAVVQADEAHARAMFRELWKAQHAIATSAIPVVFAITGHCPAGGTVLAIHADYRVMALGDFRLGLNEVQVGLYPGPVIHGAFRRLVGGHAAQLLTRGALIDPSTALRVGLVDELCESSQCIDRALAVAREICALPRDAMSRTRALTRRELVESFGAPEQADRLAEEFAQMGAEMFFAPATLERLRQMFAKKK